MSTWRVHDPEALAARICSSGLSTSAIGRSLMRRPCAPPRPSETKRTAMRGERTIVDPGPATNGGDRARHGCGPGGP